MKKQKDVYKEMERLSKQVAHDDEEVLKMLDEQDEDEDDDYDRISISYTPPIHPPKTEVKEPEHKGWAIMGLICIVFLISLGYTVIKLVFSRELHLVSLAITLICFVIIEAVNWIRKRKK